MPKKIDNEWLSKVEITGGESGFLSQIIYENFLSRNT